MAFLLFSAPVELPAGLLGRSLAKYLPAWRWQCGEAAFGSLEDLLPLDRKQLVMARSVDADQIVFCTMEPLQCQPLMGEGLPPHNIHLEIGTPTTDDPKLARAIVLLIAASLLKDRDGVGWCDIAGNGRWLSATETVAAVTRINSPTDLGALADMGRPAGSDWGNGTPAPVQRAPLPDPEPAPIEPEPETVYAAQPTEFFRRAPGGFGRKGL